MKDNIHGHWSFVLYTRVPLSDGDQHNTIKDFTKNITYSNNGASH